MLWWFGRSLPSFAAAVPAAVVAVVAVSPVASGGPFSAACPTASISVAAVSPTSGAGAMSPAVVPVATVPVVAVSPLGRASGQSRSLLGLAIVPAVATSPRLSLAVAGTNAVPVASVPVVAVSPTASASGTGTAAVPIAVVQVIARSPIEPTNGNPPLPPGKGYRDWDVLEAIQRILLATNAFDGVYLGTLSEHYGRPASDRKVVWVEKIYWRETDERDDEDTYEVLHATRFRLTLAVRDDDLLVRDRETDRLEGVLMNAIDGNALIPGFCIPGLTRLADGRWSEPRPPERQSIITGEYTYPIFGRDGGPVGHGTEP